MNKKLGKLDRQKEDVASFLNYHFNRLETDHSSSDALPDKPHPLLPIPVTSAGYSPAAVIALTVFLQLRTLTHGLPLIVMCLRGYTHTQSRKKDGRYQFLKSG